MGKIKFEKGKKPSLDAQTLLDCLEEMKPGDFVSYSDLSELIGKDVQVGKGYQALSRARKILERENGKVVEPVFGQGMRCLEDESKVDSSEYYVKKAGRAGKKAVKRLTTIENFAALSNAKKVKHNYVMSVAGVIHHLSKPSTKKQIESKVSQSHRQMELDETLNAVLETGVK